MYFNNISFLIITFVIISIILNFKFQFFNTTVYLLLITISFLCSLLIINKLNIKTILLAILIYIFLFGIFEFIYFNFGINIWNEEERVDATYQWFDVYLSNSGKDNTADLTEGYFKDDKWDISPDLAIKQKYDKFYELLNLKPGMTVIDIGCGYCQWIKYLKNKGINSIGLTLSQNQVDYGKLNGFDVHLIDARHIPSTYHGMFDAVTYLGSLEHFPKCYFSDKERKLIYKNVLEKARLLLKQNSKSGSILTTTINISNSYHWTNKDYLYAYILERCYSGRYPIEGEIDSQKGEKLIRNWNSDQSEDYRLMSFINPDHFGYFKIKWNIRKIIFIPYMFLTDPFTIHKWLYHNFDVWLWQFGSKSHIPYRNRYSPCRLKWEVFKVK